MAPGPRRKFSTFRCSSEISYLHPISRILKFQYLSWNFKPLSWSQMTNLKISIPPRNHETLYSNPKFQNLIFWPWSRKLKANYFYHKPKSLTLELESPNSNSWSIYPKSRELNVESHTLAAKFRQKFQRGTGWKV